MNSPHRLLREEVNFWRKTLEIVGNNGSPAETTRFYKALSSAERRMQQYEKQQQDA